MSHRATTTGVLSAIIVFALALTAIAAWATHIIWSIGTVLGDIPMTINQGVIAVVGAIAPPIGVVHGYFFGLANLASRIAPPSELRQPAKTKPVKRKPYRDFIKTLPCIITKQYGVECAHVSFSNEALGASGRGKGQKADDRFTLPLSPEQHREQHNQEADQLYNGIYRGGYTKFTGEEMFWKLKAINPHIACLVLWGLYTENPDTAEQRATELILSGRLGRAN